MDNLILNLRLRSQLLAFVRQFFTRHGYWEVETPLASHETCIDQWLDPVSVQVSGEHCYLQTSPEFAMKRLLAAGADAIFQICKAFRDGEQGDNHNPEFTMLEWYRQGKTLGEQMQFVEALIRESLQFACEHDWIENASLPEQIHRLSYDEAFRKFTGVSALEATQSELVELARSLRTSVTSDTDRDDILNILLAMCIEPRLAELEAVFLFDFPASQAALARVRGGDAPVAERFELYLHGAEICNGYQELTDADELRRRMRQQNAKRQQSGKPTFHVEPRLAQAMDTGLPECSGVALGFDRLAMVCLGCQSIREVIAFPFDVA